MENDQTIVGSQEVFHLASIDIIAADKRTLSKGVIGDASQMLWGEDDDQIIVIHSKPYHPLKTTGTRHRDSIEVGDADKVDSTLA